MIKQFVIDSNDNDYQFVKMLFGNFSGNECGYIKSVEYVIMR